MQGNYTQLVACLNCVIVNGEQDVTVSEVNDKLGLVSIVYGMDDLILIALDRSIPNARARVASPGFPL